MTWRFLLKYAAVILFHSVKADYDSNGDGIGDIQGIIAKLDYISVTNIVIRDKSTFEIAYVCTIQKSFSSGKLNKLRCCKGMISMSVRMDYILYIANVKSQLLH